MNLSKIDWWKANAFWLIYGGVLLWSKNYSNLGDTQVLSGVIFTSLFGLLFTYGLLKHSKVVFWISLIAFTFSIIESFVNYDNSNTIDPITVVNDIISTGLILGLVWQVLIKKS